MTRAFVFIALIIAVLAVIPWRRESPRHRFMLDQLKYLCEDEPTPAREDADHELDLVVGVHHGSRGAHV